MWPGISLHSWSAGSFNSYCTGFSILHHYAAQIHSSDACRSAVSGVGILLHLPRILLLVCAPGRLAGLDWEQLSLDTLFVDPPRAGLDEATVQLLQDFKQVGKLQNQIRNCRITLRIQNQIRPAHSRFAATTATLPFCPHLLIHDMVQLKVGKLGWCYYTPGGGKRKHVS